MLYFRALLLTACVLLYSQLQYYKQGKTEDFVKILEAARSGTVVWFLVVTVIRVSQTIHCSAKLQNSGSLQKHYLRPLAHRLGSD